MNAQRSIRIIAAALVLGIPLTGIFGFVKISVSQAAAEPPVPESFPTSSDGNSTPELAAETISFLPGTFDGIDFSGNIAFIAESLALTALDISDPAQPVVMGQLMLPTRLRDVRLVSDSIAYVLGTDLYFVDISDPSSMEILGSYPELGGSELEIKGNLLFAIDSGEIYVFHIQSPLDPILISVYEDNSSNRVVLQGDYLYLASSDLEILKIEESGILVLTGVYPGLSSGQDLWIEGNLVFIADFYLGMVILDVSDPSNPSLLSTYAAQYASSIAVKDDVAYLGGFMLGLTLVDVSDPSQPEFISNDLSYHLNHFSIHGDLLFLFDYGPPGSLAVLDISNPSAPVFQARHPYLINRSERILISGNYLFTIDNSGFIVLDIRDPSNPARIGFFNHPDLEEWNFQIEDDRAYIRDSNQLIILDISDPAEPTQLGTGFVYSYEPAVIEDEMVYHAFNTTSWGSDELTGELWVIDTHNPISTTVVYTTELGGAPGAMEAVTGVLAIELAHKEYPWPPNDPNTLQLFDITDPAAPAAAGEIELPFNGLADLEISGDLLYFCNGWGIVGIIDISDLDNPVLIGQYEQDVPFTTYYAGLDLAGDRLVVFFSGFQESTILVLNIADPTHPIVIGQVTSQARTTDVLQFEGVALVARGYALEFMRIDIPTLYLPGIFQDFEP